MCAFVCVFLSSEQSSGNVWVTHEEMENLASSTKAVSTIWAYSPLLHPPVTTHLTLSHTFPTALTPLTTVIPLISFGQSISSNILNDVLFTLPVQLTFLCVYVCGCVSCEDVCVFVCAGM